MIVYFCDRKFNQLGHATSKLKGRKIVDDKKTQYLENGVVTFSVEIAYTDDSVLNLKEATKAGNYLLRKHENEAEFYQIIERKRSTKNKTFTLECEDAGMELINGIAGPYTATSAQPAAFYFNKWLAGTGFEIGINEISSLTRKLTWDGESSIMERIASIATQFDNAEISYSFETKGLAVTRKVINIYKHRGNDYGSQLRVNLEVDNIEESESVRGVATALRCTGGTPEGQENPITLNGYTYDDGDMYVSNGILISRKATERWSHDGVTPIIKNYSFETTSKATLCAHAKTELKKVSDVEISFDIDIAKKPEGLSVGDTLYVVDDKCELYIQSRVLELSESVSRKEATITLGDYVIKGSGISPELEALAAEIAAKAKSLYTWIAYADDEEGTGISLDPTNKAYIGIAANKTVALVDISDPTVFTWSKTKGAKGDKGDTGAGAVVIVSVDVINYGAGTATLSARLLVDGIATTPTAYSWTKGENATVLGTARTLNITDLKATYNCNVVWG